MAALMVFGFHITPHLGGLPAQILGHGWLGVQAFFAISGFVIAHSVGFRESHRATSAILSSAARSDSIFPCVHLSKRLKPAVEE
jgi:peptidoglycan/LPS O-acetylase OafA/YrhL